MVEMRIHSKDELDKMSKEELIDNILELQTGILSNSVYDSGRKVLRSTLTIKLEDYEILSF